MTDPFRPPLWRRPGLFLFALAILLAALIVVLQNREERPADPGSPIIPGTIEAIRNAPAGYKGSLTVQRNFQVRLSSGELVFADFTGRDIRGCQIGSTVAIQKRGQGYVVAPKACKGA